MIFLHKLLELQLGKSQRCGFASPSLDEGTKLTRILAFGPHVQRQQDGDLGINAPIDRIVLEHDFPSNRKTTAENVQRPDCPEPERVRVVPLVVADNRLSTLHYLFYILTLLRRISTLNSVCNIRLELFRYPCSYLLLTRALAVTSIFPLPTQIRFTKPCFDPVLTYNARFTITNGPVCFRAPQLFDGPNRQAKQSSILQRSDSQTTPEPAIASVTAHTKSIDFSRIKQLR